MASRHGVTYPPGLTCYPSARSVHVCSRSNFFASPMLWSIMSSDIDGVRELVDARRAMEAELAALAAVRADENDVARMADCLAVQEETMDSPEQFLEADLQFSHGRC